MTRPAFRLWPRSLLGQMLLALALGLLVAQSISAALLYQAAENRREQALVNAAAFRLLGNPQPDRERAERRRGRENGDGNRSRRAERRAWAGASGGGMTQGLPIPLRLQVTGTSPLLAGETRDRSREQALRDILGQQGIAVGDVIVVTRPLSVDPMTRDRSRLRERMARAMGPGTRVMVAAAQMPQRAGWTVARVVEPPPQRGALRTIIGQTLLIFLFLFALQFLLLRRITRPLKLLTGRTERFARTQDPSTPLTPEGPDDIRRLIAAHNRMEAKVGALLDEKNVMLGAIGHDLKTPLAALRVRIESVEDDHERGRMAASIEDITRSLDDILSLARVGRASEPPERAELSSLVASVVEEFEDMGDPVTLAETSRIVHPVHVTWLRRALRNLIANAVRYGGSATVSLVQSGAETVLRVEDSGPGIPEDRIEAMQEPFTRGEASRNRDTGGAGLGLTLARAIAEQHGGRLELSNRSAGGLRADIILPPAPASGA
ncbi:sensor histidine kinase [Allopontixanthobacter sediminis]|nr:ATP-binding protein [Allopontixanthobacter sediminis]